MIHISYIYIYFLYFNNMYNYNSFIIFLMFINKNSQNNLNLCCFFKLYSFLNTNIIILFFKHNIILITYFYKYFISVMYSVVPKYFSQVGQNSFSFFAYQVIRCHRSIQINYILSFQKFQGPPTLIVSYKQVPNYCLTY